MKNTHFYNAIQRGVDALRRGREKLAVLRGKFVAYRTLQDHLDRGLIRNEEMLRRTVNGQLSDETVARLVRDACERAHPREMRSTHPLIGADFGAAYQLHYDLAAISSRLRRVTGME